MKKISLVIPALAFIFLFLTGTALATHEPFVIRYSTALDQQNVEEMTFLIKKNKEAVPKEVRLLIDEALAPGVTDKERMEKIYLAESMATEYKNITGDVLPLKEAKTRVFESGLDPVSESAAVNGVHTIQATSIAGAKNVFLPGNIVIKKGETVKWVNGDNVAHLLASMYVIGEQGIFSPRVAPGNSWEYRFDKAGEYYYICFIHKVMYGKVTVVE
ncbi:MAG: plastocyanin/azurin family copper-binding protein [Deltaproteobacteria bacterium]